ncbi:MAG: 1-deoxy-D-xylulose-5-phosphate reductoisomerase [Chitinispirillaceae bacterium]|nr:1-deoxy-D-xylulose-5-phosphate reductoisomerase [Chitinispirillaceae bacterium]
MNDTAQNVIILGSTGSIGTSTLNCIRRFPDRFRITGLAAGRNIDLLCRQIDEFRPEKAYIADVKSIGRLRERCGSKVHLVEGKDGLETLVREASSDIVVNALVGAVGLRPTIAALKKKNRVALANKESLVIGGDLITGLVADGWGELVPVDSEHSAILQCLSGVKAPATIESIVLTASGGPFRTRPLEGFATITPSEALTHPTWAMGKKITIDAATLMNKGFEVIEAHHLFSMPYERLRVVIHPQSIVHSLVEFYDGAFMAQLGCPDMELPIQYALAFPRRLPMNGKRLSLSEIGTLEFFEPDYVRFPCLRLCIEAGKQGGTAPAVVNAANEVAVAAFLAGTIPFTDIARVVAAALDRYAAQPATSLDAIEAADAATRRSAHETIKQKGLS